MFLTFSFAKMGELKKIRTESTDPFPRALDHTKSYAQHGADVPPVSPQVRRLIQQDSRASSREADSRLSNSSMPPVTPSPTGSSNNSPNNPQKSQHRSKSAMSRDSIRSQSPGENTDNVNDTDSLVVPQYMKPSSAEIKVRQRSVMHILPALTGLAFFAGWSQYTVEYLAIWH